MFSRLIKHYRSSSTLSLKHDSDLKISWSLLPTELKDIIFINLLENENKTAQYASVCKEWQDFFEKRNFSRLKLTISRLVAFYRIAPRVRGHVKYIWLCIELQEYNCTQCRQKESKDWYDRDMWIVKDALKSTFLTLSQWPHEGNLTLDITAYSPSDTKHHFQSARFESDTVSTFETEHALANIHDPDHGWIYGKSKRRAIGAYQRFSSAIEIEHDVLIALPKVSAVTTLLLRRQNRRRWSQAILKDMLAVLPNLEVFHYEPEREYLHLKQNVAELRYWILSESLRKSRVRRIILFEDCNRTFSNIYRPFDTAADWTLHPGVARVLMEATLDLEHFSAAFLMDAGDFFHTINPYMAWNKLQSLTLTSQKLVPETPRAHIHDMLLKAAAAARQMPKLRSMEIWNGGKGHACVFRYQALHICDPARITWKGSWDLLLDRKVTQAWEAVAQLYVPCKYHPSCEFQVLKELLKEGIVLESHGDAVLALDLLHEVVRPVSLWQIRQEHKANER